VLAGKKGSASGAALVLLGLNLHLSHISQHFHAYLANPFEQVNYFFLVIREAVGVEFLNVFLPRET